MVTVNGAGLDIAGSLEGEVRFKDLTGGGIADGNGEIDLDVPGTGVVASPGLLRNDFDFLSKTRFHMPVVLPEKGESP